jgi:hypothetical protein
VCGFSYNSSIWASPEPTEDNVSIAQEGTGVNDVRYDSYKAEEGLACKVDLHKPIEPGRVDQKREDMTITIQTKIKQIEKDADIPVSFVYRHTLSRSPSGYISSISIGNILSVNLSDFSHEVWKSPAKESAKLSNNK